MNAGDKLVVYTSIACILVLIIFIQLGIVK
jgi:hypothetical protein